MMQIDILDKTNEVKKEHIDLLKDILQFAATIERVGDNAEVALTIVTAEEIRELNKEYRHRNEPTDVLSFPIEDPLEKQFDINDMPLHLGDIIICHEKVIEQKERYNHSYERELAFLAVHGFLHLLGYTHDNKVEEKLMFQKQEEILKEFNLER